MGEEFARSLGRLAVAQVCRETGFESAQASAINALAELIGTYVETIGKEAHENAEVGGRSQENVEDLLLALKALGVDLDQLVTAIDSDLPFITDVPRFPAVPSSKSKEKTVKTEKKDDALADQERDPLPEYAPSVCPPLPPRHTYKASQIDAVQRKLTEKQARLQVLQQQRMFQGSISDMESRARRRVVGSGGWGEGLENNGALTKDYMKGLDSTFHPNPQPVMSRKDEDGEAENAAASAKKQHLSKEDRILRGLHNDYDSD